MFVCHLREDGGYVWRSTCGRAACGRIGTRYVAKLDGRLIGEAASLLEAMALALADMGCPVLLPALRRRR